MPDSVTPDDDPEGAHMTSVNTLTSEKADLLQALAQHRFLFRHTVRNLDDEQAARRTTVSALCLGGLIKHVTAVERAWIAFILEGPTAMDNYADMTPAQLAAWADNFRMTEGETLAGLLAEYDEVAGRTADVVAALPDLDVVHPLPEAPWYEPGASWSARRVLAHVIAETAQHAGHADIIRESLDGEKTMA
jgi:uncharacterized damage-inducible protein DinB